MDPNVSESLLLGLLRRVRKSRKSLYTEHFDRLSMREALADRWP